MKQCEDCTKQKKADNCIKCAQEWKEKAQRLERGMEGVMSVVKQSTRYELQHNLRQFLDGFYG